MSTSLIDQVIAIFSDCMSREAAQRVISIDADEATKLQLDSLAEKANLGNLNIGEKADYERLLVNIHFVALLQARARSLLKH